jgi:hypothetical protein
MENVDVIFKEQYFGCWVHVEMYTYKNFFQKYVEISYIY